MSITGAPPSPRLYPGISQANDLIYVFGGCGSGGTFQSENCAASVYPWSEDFTLQLPWTIFMNSTQVY